MSESRYWDLDSDLFVSDDERDEDGDGLINYDEVSGRMQPGYWKGCYPSEGEYPIPYAGTKAYDADSDGDGVLDGADDQDFDDIPNIMELSRNMAGDTHIQASCGDAGVYDPAAPARDVRQPVQPVHARPVLADLPAPPEHRVRLRPVHRRTSSRSSSTSAKVTVGFEGPLRAGPRPF